MLSGGQRLHGRLGMLVPHGDNRNGINVFVGQHDTIVREDFLHAEFLRLFSQAVRSARTKCSQFKVGNANDGFTMNLPEPAQSNDTDAKLVHSASPRYLEW